MNLKVTYLKIIFLSIHLLLSLSLKGNFTYFEMMSNIFLKRNAGSNIHNFSLTNHISILMFPIFIITKVLGNVKIYDDKKELIYNNYKNIEATLTKSRFHTRTERHCHLNDLTLKIDANHKSAIFESGISGKIIKIKKESLVTLQKFTFLRFSSHQKSLLLDYCQYVSHTFESFSFSTVYKIITCTVMFSEVSQEFRLQIDEGIAASNQIFDRKIDEIFMTKKNKIMFILFSVFLITLTGIFAVIIYVKYRKNMTKNKTIQIVKQELSVKEIIISQKEEESSHLKARLNDSINELYEFAKSNNPNFYVRFQEIYPNFQTQLLSFDHNLQTSELHLLALIYLDFETKKIADITFKSVRTIQNRKYRLRKKLGIISSEDFSVWLKANCK